MGLITADEFWANQTLAKRDIADSAHEQESGLPSAFLVSVRDCVCYRVMSWSHPPM